MEFYAERFRAMFRELGENVTNLGSQVGDVSQQVADWLRNRGGGGRRRRRPPAAGGPASGGPAAPAAPGRGGRPGRRGGTRPAGVWCRDQVLPTESRAVRGSVGDSVGYPHLRRSWAG